MSKIRSVASIQAAIETAQAVDFNAAFAAAQAAEVLVDGEVYQVRDGIQGGTVDGLLLGQQVGEDGKTKYKFQVGSGFDQKIITCGASRVVVETEDGVKVQTTAQVAAAQKANEAKIERLKAELAIAEERENLQVGAEYNIKVGRGLTRRVVAATLVGIGETEVGRRFKFIFGHEFETELAIIGAEHIVWDDADVNDVADEVAKGSGLLAD